MKMTARDRALLGIVAVLVLGFGFYHFLLKPEHRKASALQTQIASARSALTKAEQQAAAGRAAEVALRVSTPNWKAAERAIPAQADVPPLLKLLYRSAVAAHVTMDSISFPDATSSGETGSSSGSSDSTTTASGPTAIPVQLTFVGGYQALSRLVHQLDLQVTISKQRLRDKGPLIGISAVTVNPGAATNASGDASSALNVSLTADIYQRSAVSTSSNTTEATG